MTVCRRAGGRNLGGTTIRNAYATGSVAGTGNNPSGGTSDAPFPSNVGGLAGVNSGSINNAYVYGQCEGHWHCRRAGGIQNNGSISNAYATGSVTGSSCVGGSVCSAFFGTLTNSHYDIDQMVINGSHYVTQGGLYDAQYQDWFTHGETLNIADYAATLPLDGTSGYYTVGSVQGMKDLLGFVDNASYKFRLSTNIDLSTASGFFVPILVSEFDGAGHVISNLAVNQPFNSDIGMFGEVSATGAVKNLGLTNVYIIGGDGSVGGLAGYNNGSISNAYVTGSVAAFQWVGGLVGNNNGSISNVYATGSVNGSAMVVGGLVGNNYGSISNAYATGSVNGSSVTGGLVGESIRHHQQLLLGYAKLRSKQWGW